MAVHRTPPTCPKCGEPIKGIYDNRGRGFVGDTFVCWDWNSHYVTCTGTIHIVDNNSATSKFFSRKDIGGLEDNELLESLKKANENMKTTKPLEKIIRFTPGFDKRNVDSSKNYGIHCMNMFMVLRGEFGAISFTIYTGWYLESVEHSSNIPRGTGVCICYHSLVPQYEGQTTDKKCDWLDNKECYCDCNYTGGEELFNKFVAEGEQAVWDELERRYNVTFANQLQTKQ